MFDKNHSGVESLDRPPICAFCGDKKLINYECRLPDSNERIIPIFSCGNCGALLPVYNEKIISHQSTKLQTDFHDKLFGNDSLTDMAGARDDMIDMLNKQETFLASAKKNNEIVCDIGAGRGNLTSALMLKGYNVYACEPSGYLYNKAIKSYNLTSKVLKNADAFEFCDWMEESSIKPSVIYLWHILEHVPNSISLLNRLKQITSDMVTYFIQMPLLCSPYLYKEHYFLATFDWIYYLESVLDCKLIYISHSRNTKYVTAYYSNDKNIPGVDVKRPFRSLTQFERQFILYENWLN